MDSGVALDPIKDFRAYVDKLNAAIAGTDNEGKSVEEIVKIASGPLFNNSAQTWNHGFYWYSLSPEKTAALLNKVTYIREGEGVVQLPKLTHMREGVVQR